MKTALSAKTWKFPTTCWPTRWFRGSQVPNSSSPGTQDQEDLVLVSSIHPGPNVQGVKPSHTGNPQALRHISPSPLHLDTQTHYAPANLHSGLFIHHRRPGPWSAALEFVYNTGDGEKALSTKGHHSPLAHFLVSVCLFFSFFFFCCWGWSVCLLFVIRDARIPVRSWTGFLASVEKTPLPAQTEDQGAIYQRNRRGDMHIYFNHEKIGNQQA